MKSSRIIIPALLKASLISCSKKIDFPIAPTVIPVISSVKINQGNPTDTVNYNGVKLPFDSASATRLPVSR